MAVELAIIPAIMTLIEDGRCKTLLLNVGNQLMILCSINTYKNAHNTKETTSGNTSNLSISV
ncbi:hypothetical protein D3C85_1673050 [compost metagenome]